MIYPCFWFNGEAEDAAKFYTSVFKNSKILRTVPYGKFISQATGQREGSVMTVEIELGGSAQGAPMRLLALNGGPMFKINPAISIFVACESEEEINLLWGKLRKKTRMELQKYPFADKYGWCEDQFGVNWQLILNPNSKPRKQKIAPALLFANGNFGKAGEAVELYVSLFNHSNVDMIARDPNTQAILHASFTLDGQAFVAMEGPLEHEFGFTPGTSFIVECEDQRELDRIWSKLSAVPEAEQCGWLQDRFGVSWQVLPSGWNHMIADSDPEKRERLMMAILGMKKPDVDKLRNIK